MCDLICDSNYYCVRSKSCDMPYLYLYLFFGVDHSIVDDFIQRGYHSSSPMHNPKITGMVM